MKVQHLTDSIWIIENFLTQTECDELIIFSEQKGYEEATVSLKSGAKMMKGVRNNYRLIHSDPNLAEKYWKKLNQFCPKKIEDNNAVGLNEQFRFYKYESEQRFKKHIDGRFKRNELEESRITFMIYLNDDYIGGETKFNDVTINPKTGTALCFIHEQKHEGAPVSEGEKFVLRSDIMYRKITNAQQSTVVENK
ncbi:2OG-Fe(II) oxygenase [Winogradskyella maritima]|uniref:2OG-Fe(II) oxygenase n=1 Tax=Winogradskyella maritima TaxID=1517766 RepID=A0ABV8AJ49_9FLAO|nr:2OG-Fe(II) oxygenase [Winogradskyella maritima]